MGITVKDKIEQFKRDCKSVSYYQKVIAYREQEIAGLDHELTTNQLHSEDRFTANKKAPILEQDELIKEVEDFKQRVQEIYARLDMIQDLTDRQMVMDAFIVGKYYKQLINSYHFNDSSALYRHINKVIEKIV